VSERDVRLVVPVDDGQLVEPARGEAVRDHEPVDLDAAEDVVPVRVRVHDGRRRLGQAGEELACVGARRAGIERQRPACADDRAQRRPIRRARR